jgi:ATP-dependent Zn protease
MKVTRALQATAYHEAGHAVAGWYVGIEAKNLSIVPDADSLGRYEQRLTRRTW